MKIATTLKCWHKRTHSIIILQIEVQFLRRVSIFATIIITIVDKVQSFYLCGAMKLLIKDGGVFP